MQPRERLATTKKSATSNAYHIFTPLPFEKTINVNQPTINPGRHLGNPVWALHGPDQLPLMLADLWMMSLKGKYDNIGDLC